jgi:hypothetical protein
MLSNTLILSALALAPLALAGPAAAPAPVITAAAIFNPLEVRDDCDGTCHKLSGIANSCSVSAYGPAYGTDGTATAAPTNGFSIEQSCLCGTGDFGVDPWWENVAEYVPTLL